MRNLVASGMHVTKVEGELLLPKFLGDVCTAVEKHPNQQSTRHSRRVGALCTPTTHAMSWLLGWVELWNKQSRGVHSHLSFREVSLILAIAPLMPGP